MVLYVGASDYCNIIYLINSVSNYDKPKRNFMKKSIKADFHLAENIARSTFSAHFLLNCSNQIQISEHISKESEREKSIARHFPLNGNPPLVTPVLNVGMIFQLILRVIH